MTTPGGVVPFVGALARHGHRPALLSGDHVLSYERLSGLVADTADQLGPVRRLVLLEAANTVESVTTYLAALHGGHIVLLVPVGQLGPCSELIDTYDPDVVAGRRPGGWTVEDRHVGSQHELHPDLALLLSTSGSTGSPKLARLSARNIQSNAEAIVRSLRIRPADRAITTLPMSYCYGLSVLNSHLLAGAALVLTDRSVVDECFWEQFRRHGATTFAGVPHTFDLLDRVGFEDMDLPSLRYVTQAGGPLAPDRVRHYAELGRRRGWDLIVMYGQTEATARMAYLPPHLARSHPQAIGVPVPGGSFRLEPLPGGDPGTGELVYSGPNVMLGYATGPADLALGRTVDALRTGDVARRTGEGLYEIVCRRSRFAKLFGLRIDLARVEERLGRRGVRAACTQHEDVLVVAVEPGGSADPQTLRRQTAEACGLPVGSVQVHLVDAVPRLGNGKVDYAAVALLTERSQEVGPATAPDLVGLFAELLGRPDATKDDTFVSLGGDSLSYVEMSVRLEDVLGRVPAGWHTTRIGDLMEAERAQPRWGRDVEASVLLRALAIVLVVGTHVAVFHVPGGAHVLLAVAGFNFARFRPDEAVARARVARGARSLARIVVPSVGFIAAAQLLTGRYGMRDVLLLGGLGRTSAGPFWFVETLTYLLAAVTSVRALPVAHRAERRWPFAAPIALALAGLVSRYGVDLAPATTRIYSAHVLVWLFALGWAAAAARSVWHRALVTVLAAVTVPGFFGDARREAVVVAGLLLLVWVPTVRVPRWFATAASTLAAASLSTYLVHWLVYPRLQPYSLVLALAASLLAGVAYRWVTGRAVSAVTAGVRECVRRVQGLRRRVPVARPAASTVTAPSGGLAG